MPIKTLFPRVQADDLARKSVYFDRRPMSPKDGRVNMIQWGAGATESQVPDLNDYKQLARWYLCADLIFAALKTVTDALTGAELKVEEKVKDEKIDSWGIIDQHPFEEWMKNPNPQMHESDLYHAWYIHLMLYGVIRSVMVKGQQFAPYDLARASDYPVQASPGRLQFLTPVQPGLLEPQHARGIQSEVRGFVWTTAENDKYWVPQGDVAVDLIYNPEAYGIGVSPIRTLVKKLELEVAMFRHIETHFLNSGVPAGIVRVKYDPSREEPPSDAELETMAQRWSKRFAMGGQRQGEVAFVSSDIEFQRLADQLNELISSDLFDHIESRVAAVTGVPSRLFLAGLRHGSVRANGREENRAFFDQTIWPLLERIRLKMQNTVMPERLQGEKAKNLRLTWMLTRMPVAATREKERKDALADFWLKKIIKRNEVRRELGFSPLPDKTPEDEGNQFYDGSSNLGTNAISADGQTGDGGTPTGAGSNGISRAAIAKSITAAVRAKLPGSV